VGSCSCSCSCLVCANKNNDTLSVYCHSRRCPTFFFFLLLYSPLAQRRMGIPAVQSPEDRLKEKLNRLFQDVLSDVNRTKVPTSFLCLFFILYFVHVFYLSTVA